MAKERPSWFWALTIIFMMAWAMSGTQAIFYILEGKIILGEAVIIITTICLVIIYYSLDYLLARR
jgi:hypothetical protein